MSSLRNKYFDSFDAFNDASMGDAIDEWLQAPAILNMTNGLQYWAAMASSSHPLVAMAIDYLSIPGT